VSLTTGTRCADCGAENLGTNFCESCGSRASAPAVAYLPQVKRSGVGWRVAALVTWAVAELLPWLFVGLPMAGQTFTVFVSIVIGLTALFVLLGAVTGNADSGGKTGAVILSIGYFVVAGIILPWVALPIGQWGYWAVETFGLLLLFLAWGVSRPFRGPGYAGIAVLIVAALIAEWSQTGFYSAMGLYAQAGLLSAVVRIACFLAVVGLSIAFEGRKSVEALSGR
jgi:hypothetical protein